MCNIKFEALICLISLGLADVGFFFVFFGFCLFKKANYR